MKRLIVAVLAIAMLPSIGVAQNSLEDTVKRLLDDVGFVSGFDEHELARSGDRVTITALGMVDLETSFSEHTAGKMILLIDLAFRSVEIIQRSEDRNPAVSLLFLKVAGSQPYSRELAEKIALLADRLTHIKSSLKGPPER